MKVYVYVCDRQKNFFVSMVDRGKTWTTDWGVYDLHGIYEFKTEDDILEITSRGYIEDAGMVSAKEYEEES